MLLTQNSKMKKSSKQGIRVYNFTLPAYKSESGIVTCPSAGECKKFCYARKGTYKWNPVRKKHEANLKASRSYHFTARMIEEIDKLYTLTKKRKEVLVIRIHDAGDFYSLDYLKKWLWIIEEWPGVMFYAYTKQVALLKSIEKPPNFYVIYSYDGLGDHLIKETDCHSKVFKTKEQLEKEGYVDASQDDMKALTHHKVGLVLH